MCPSYQATREELHSTRGRAHLLWEMLEGDLVTDGWRSTEVRDALDLCLSCKGCLSDCPVNVDMATYKAEFTHHHYAGRPWARPLSHWSMGWLPLLVADRVAWRRGWSTGWHGTRLAKRLGGIAPEREIPAFAEQTFTSWFAGRAAAGSGGHPRHGRAVAGHASPTTWRREVGRAAVEVLEAAGYEVVLPRRPGVLRADLDLHRPTASGQATHQALAGRSWRRISTAGTPIVGTGAELHRGAAARRGRTSAGRLAAPPRWPRRPSRSPSSSPAQAGNRRRSRRMRSCRRTVTSTPCSASTPTAR